jgi:hypothetical protein
MGVGVTVRRVRILKKKAKATDFPRDITMSQTSITNPTTISARMRDNFSLKSVRTLP